MPLYLASLMVPIVSTLGIIFLMVMAARSDAAKPLGWPAALLCITIIAALSYGIRSAVPSVPWAWPVTLGLCAGFLAWGVYDQRAYLFAFAGPQRGHVALGGQSTVALVLTAVTEELLFRGLMQSSLMDSLSGPGGAVTALFIVNLSFAIAHARHGMTFALSAGFFGMIMSMTVILSGSVWPAAVTHALWNVVVGLARRRAEAVAAA